MVSIRTSVYLKIHVTPASGEMVASGLCGPPHTHTQVNSKSLKRQLFPAISHRSSVRGGAWLLSIPPSLGLWLDLVQGLVQVTRCATSSGLCSAHSSPAPLPCCYQSRGAAVEAAHLGLSTCLSFSPLRLVLPTAEGGFSDRIESSPGLQREAEGLGILPTSSCSRGLPNHTCRCPP